MTSPFESYLQQSRFRACSEPGGPTARIKGLGLWRLDKAKADSSEPTVPQLRSGMVAAQSDNVVFLGRASG
ncbi:hypothetical protein A9X00_20965 [Mycobacterium sp. 1245805.9]|nr:hypothetical protein A9X00_20965 [Mycobacterium sp. 1245805.9]